jgi:hypothetical protein
MSDVIILLAAALAIYFIVDAVYLGLKRHPSRLYDRPRKRLIR